MTNTDRTKLERAPMSSLRKTSLVAGVFYLLTFVSIPTLWLYGSVRGPNYILGAICTHYRAVGVLAGHLPRRQRLQALVYHGWHVTQFDSLYSISAWSEHMSNNYVK